QIVVLEANAGFALLIRKGPPVEIVKERPEFFQLRGDERFIIGLANARIRQEGKRRRQRRLEPVWHRLRIQERVREGGRRIAWNAGNRPAKIGLREILPATFGDCPKSGIDIVQAARFGANQAEKMTIDEGVKVGD